MLQQLQQSQRENEDTKLHFENLSSRTTTAEQGLQDKVERIAMLENANDQLENDNKELCQKVKVLIIDYGHKVHCYF